MKLRERYVLFDFSMLLEPIVRIPSYIHCLLLNFRWRRCEIIMRLDECFTDFANSIN